MFYSNISSKIPLASNACATGDISSTSSSTEKACELQVCNFNHRLVQVQKNLTKINEVVKYNLIHEQQQYSRHVLSGAPLVQQ